MNSLKLSIACCRQKLQKMHKELQRMASDESVTPGEMDAYAKGYEAEIRVFEWLTEQLKGGKS